MQWLKLGVVDIQLAKKIINENFTQDRGEREKAFSLYLSKPYQLIHDSPTIKHYTEWDLYDSLNLSDISRQQLKYSETENIIEIIDDTITIPKNNIQVDDLLNDNVISSDEHKLVSLAYSLSRRITISNEGEYHVRHVVNKNKYLSPSHLIINVPKDKQIKVIYEVLNLGEGSLITPIISVDIEDDSTLDFQFVNFSSDNSLLFSYIKANIKGTMHSSIFVNGNKMGHVQFNTRLEEGSVSEFSSRAFGTHSNKIDVVNNVIHLGQRSVSNGFMKAISNDQAFTVVRGIATIDETAINSSTSIIGRSLVLGKDAKAVVSPMLEVKTGRVVMAKHSAAVSRIDENQIFYLQTRGLSKREAEGIIIRGFIIEEQDPETLKDRIEEILKSLGY
ncbi:SufD family Fe-S cluster assembly protein [Saccharolobus shibatae]|uniref:Iron-sulfur cluster assembly protein SufD n=1 Tax=Saccharolobus shibatae TaxID=2286 RepID=A0A8F5C333_9CREN|nr:SufD family Fe-S cluster assembly protein [Saccharolobus shibatae]QXJ36035.1 Iron-sulfur cluster assembly protein SufD [Saccharolobus shibatae]